MTGDTCQVTDPRTIDNAMDKTKSWMVIPNMLVAFPLTQEGSNQAAALERQRQLKLEKERKGAKRRQSSVPPNSDTARAKQSKKDSDAAKAGEQAPQVPIGKGRPRGIDRGELNTISSQFLTEIKKKVLDLKPKHYRNLQALGSDWYKQIYHTRYQVPKKNYLEHLYEKAVGDIKVKEAVKAHVEPYIQALKILQRAADPTIVGLPDPHSSSTTSTQGQKRTGDTTVSSPIQGKEGHICTWLTAVTGPADGKSQPIGGSNCKIRTGKGPC